MLGRFVPQAAVRDHTREQDLHLRQWMKSLTLLFFEEVGLYRGKGILDPRATKGLGAVHT